jgi:hypothetical protein
VLAYLSCDYFYSPVRGRWNVLDPKQELVVSAPVVDGYVSSGGGWQGDANLIADPSTSVILMRFDTEDFPDIVKASYLRMTKISANTADPTLEIYRIIQRWDSSISFTEVYTPGVFFDDKHQERVVLPKSATEVVVPLTEAFSGSSSSLSWGIVIFSRDELVQFEQSEGPIPPVLLIEPI